MRQILPVMSALALAAISGIVHGRWTDRWGLAPELAALPGQLAQLPMVLGDWQGETIDGMESRTPNEVSGHLYRRYLNRRTGVVVTVALVGGRPGPVSIHDPRTCYSASGYEVVTPMKHTAKLAADAPPAVFRTAQFVRTKSADRTLLRIFWSWSATGAWSAPEGDVRLAFAAYPVLYKLYLIRELPGTDQPVAEDPCLDLLRRLQPEMERALFSPAS